MSEGNVFPFLGASRNRRRGRVKTHDSDINPNDRHQPSVELYFVLRDALVSTIAGGLAGVGKAGLSTWSPSKEEAQRAAMAASVWVTVSHDDDDADADDTARAWFVGLNPCLSGESPVDALMSGRLQHVCTAATAFEQDTWSG